MTINMNEVIEGVTLTKVCSIKPDEDSDESKQITLKVKYDGLTLGDVFTKALSNDVIKWQNNNRKRFTTLPKTVEIHAKSPGATQVDPETAMRVKLAGMSKADAKAYLEGLLAEAE